MDFLVRKGPFVRLALPGRGAGGGPRIDVLTYVVCVSERGPPRLAAGRTHRRISFVQYDANPEVYSVRLAIGDDRKLLSMLGLGVISKS